MYNTNVLYIIFKLPVIDFMIVYFSKHLPLIASVHFILLEILYS